MLKSAPATILIVDDTPANLHLLVSMLKERGYKLKPVTSGATALEAARVSPPDLILLDVGMPEMDGYEVCRQLKNDPLLQEIPVIFISALNETMDKVEAFRAGGIDYVTKPFQCEEVEARVRTHLELRRQRKELEENNEQLRRLDALQENLMQMLVHDMRSPIFVLKSILTLLAPFLPKQTEEVDTLMQAARDSISGLTEMVAQLLDIGRMESGSLPIHKTRQDLVNTVRQECKACAHTAAEKHLSVVAPKSLPATYDEKLLRRVIGNLLGNALRYTRKDGEIRITVTCSGDHAHIAVMDKGPGIAPEFHERIFEKYGQVDNQKRKYGVGLGLTFCKLAIAAHGGRIGVESAVREGSTFWFTLPLNSEEKTIA